MNTFKQFLEESRTSTVDVATLIKWMERNAVQFLDGGNALWRGADGGAAMKIGSSVSSTPRVSTHGIPNIYTLWMSNAPSFKGLPRREQSFIASLSPRNAQGYGRLHLLIPSDKAKIGIVGEDDIWAKTGWQADEVSVIRLAYDDMAKDIARVFEEHDLPYDTWSRLSSSLKKVDTDMVHAAFLPKAWFRMAYDDSNVNNLYEFMNKMVHPSMFKFMTGAEIASLAHKYWYEQSSEVWVEGPVALIAIEHLTPEEKTRLLEWAADNSPLLEDAIKSRGTK